MINQIGNYSLIIGLFASIFLIFQSSNVIRNRYKNLDGKIFSALSVQSLMVLISFFSLSCFLLALSFLFTLLEWPKLSVTISIFNVVFLAGYVCLFLAFSASTFDVFEPLFAFELQHHNYQRLGFL